MSRLNSLISQKPLLTQLQLRALIGIPHSPCSVCGSPLFSVTGRGEWICWGCDYDRATAPRGIALRLFILVAPPLGAGGAGGDCGLTRNSDDPGAPRGITGITADYDALLASHERERAILAAAYQITRPPGHRFAGTWTIYPLAGGWPIASRAMLAEEYFESLPTELPVSK